MIQTVMRVPRVRRLEYFIAFLGSYVGREFNEDQAREAVQRKVHEFELNKAKALGKQRPTARRGGTTLQECLYLAVQLGLTDQFKRLTPEAALVLDPVQRRHFLLERMWQTYPRFRQVVLTARDNERLDLPFYDWDIARQKGDDLYKLDLDRLSFEAIRDLATDLALINWHPTEDKRQIVYPVACLATHTEIFCLTGMPVKQQTFAQQCIHQTAIDLNLLTVKNSHYESQAYARPKDQGYLILQTDIDQVFIRDYDVSSGDFEQALWQEYLSLSDMRQRFPVLYPNLRNQVCAALRISDPTFDRYLLSLIQQPHRLNIYPSGGVLNYAVNLAHIGKFLPPQADQGDFIVYLKIERRNAL